MKKTLLAFALLFASFSAQAVDLTITLTAGQATRFAAVCGKIKKLVDAQVPPQPRACTMAEAKTMIVERMRALVVDVEGAELTKQATDAVVVPAFDPQ